MKIDKLYVRMIRKILSDGYVYEDPNRKGVTRIEVDAMFLEHPVSDGYPIITARKTYFKGAVGELLLFLKGATDIRYYWSYGIRFWDKDWARFQGYTEDKIKIIHSCWKKGTKLPRDTGFYMGKIYGAQYKKQYHVFDNFKKNPLRTDLIVNSWQLSDLKDMALIPCHYDFQLVGTNDGFSIVWNQRSTDLLLGTPINVQFYYLMGMLLEAWSGHKFKGVSALLKKVHLYDNGIDLAGRLIDLPKKSYNNDVTVELEVNESLKNLPFSEFIKCIEPNAFKLKNYTYVLNETVDMLTYKE